MVNSFGIDFIARKDKADKTTASLFARITVNGKFRKVGLKEKIPFRCWNSKQECVLGKGAEITEINEYIDDVRARIKAAYRKLESRDVYITAQQVKDEYTGLSSKRHQDHMLLKLVKKYIAEYAVHLKEGTQKNFGATEKYVANFVQHAYKCNDIHRVLFFLNNKIF